MDVELLFAFVDAIHGTDVDARSVLGADAGLGDDVGHDSSKNPAK
jgi:hypothetical protein